MYRSSLFVLLHLLFIGLNVYGWSRSGVNHVLIFEIDPRNHLNYQQLFELGSLLGTLWLTSVLTFVLSAYYDLEYYVHPLVLLVCLLAWLFNPLPRFHASSRAWLLRVLVI